MYLHMYRGMKILTSVTNPGHILNLRGFFPLDSAVVSQLTCLQIGTKISISSTQNTHAASFLLIPLSYHRGERNNPLLRAIEKQSLTLARRRGLACTQSVNGNQCTIKHQRWDTHFCHFSCLE